MSGVSAGAAPSAACVCDTRRSTAPLAATCWVGLGWPACTATPPLRATAAQAAAPRAARSVTRTLGAGGPPSLATTCSGAPTTHAALRPPREGPSLRVASLRRLIWATERASGGGVTRRGFTAHSTQAGGISPSTTGTSSHSTTSLGPPAPTGPVTGGARAASACTRGPPPSTAAPRRA